MPGEAQPESRSDKGRILIFIVILIAAVILVYVWFTSGGSGLMALAQKWLTYLIVAVVIGLIIFAVMKLLAKPKVDLIENNWKDIIDAGILSKPPMVRDLYATGDRHHGEFRLGRIIGYCQLQSYKDLDLIANMTSAQIEEMERNGRIPSEFIIKEDCFIFKKFPFPFSIFEEPKVMRVLESEHSQIIGDVKIYAVSVVKVAKFYYPNRAHLDIARIDIGIIREAWRGQIFQFLRDSVSIQQRAVGLDSEHKKSMDQRKLLKIPSMMGDQENKGG